MTNKQDTSQPLFTEIKSQEDYESFTGSNKSYLLLLSKKEIRFDKECYVWTGEEKGLF